MKTRKLYVKWYSDPGHGWLRVRRADLNLLPGLADTISRYSYQKNGWVYLEEDCDASKFFHIARALDYEVVERWNPPADIQSPIRFYDSYRS